MVKKIQDNLNKHSCNTRSYCIYWCWIYKVCKYGIYYEQLKNQCKLHQIYQALKQWICNIRY